MTGTKIARSPADPSQRCNTYYFHPGTLKNSKDSYFNLVFFTLNIRISPSIHPSLAVFVGFLFACLPPVIIPIALLNPIPSAPFFSLILCSMLGPMPSPRLLLKQRPSRCFDVCAPGLVGDCGGCSNVGCTQPWVHHSVSTSGQIGVHWPMIHWPNAWETHTNKQIQKCRVTPVYCR